MPPSIALREWDGIQPASIGGSFRVFSCAWLTWSSLLGGDDTIVRSESSRPSVPVHAAMSFVEHLMEAMFYRAYRGRPCVCRDLRAESFLPLRQQERIFVPGDSIRCLGRRPSRHTRSMASLGCAECR